MDIMRAPSVCQYPGSGTWGFEGGRDQSDGVTIRPAMADFFWLYAPSAADLDYKPYCCAQVMDPAEMN